MEIAGIAKVRNAALAARDIRQISGLPSSIPGQPNGRS
jgi:hypothetical protein